MPEKFENSIFTLKIHPMFSIHTHTVWGEIWNCNNHQWMPVMLDFVFEEDQGRNHTIIAVCLHFVLNWCFQIPLVWRVFEKFNFLMQYVDSRSNRRNKAVFQISQVWCGQHLSVQLHFDSDSFLYVQFASKDPQITGVCCKCYSRHWDFMI